MVLEFNSRKPNHFDGCPCPECEAWRLRRAPIGKEAPPPVSKDPEPEKRIRRIGGEGWVTADDLERFSLHAQTIIRALNDGEWHNRADLEEISGSQRVASRIDELRDIYAIETQRAKGGTANYRLTGRLDKERERTTTTKIHCQTCRCKQAVTELPR